ncbi:hypothetical protein EDD21DRAFT_373146 [Dissophora ornata]|nr:hypothetical protein EDD21DRAFT_373146 [Dissophora ornata]
MERASLFLCFSFTACISSSILFLCPFVCCGMSPLHNRGILLWRLIKAAKDEPSQSARRENDGYTQAFTAATQNTRYRSTAVVRLLL